MSKISSRKEGNILAVAVARPGRELWSWFFLPAILPFSCRSSGLASDKAPPLHSNTTAARESQLARGGRPSGHRPLPAQSSEPGHRGILVEDWTVKYSDSQILSVDNVTICYLSNNTFMFVHGVTNKKYFLVPYSFWTHKLPVFYKNTCCHWHFIHVAAASMTPIELEAGGGQARRGEAPCRLNLDILDPGWKWSSATRNWRRCSGARPPRPIRTRLPVVRGAAQLIGPGQPTSGPPASPPGSRSLLASASVSTLLSGSSITRGAQLIVEMRSWGPVCTSELTSIHLFFLVH